MAEHRLRNGHVITDELIEELAREAEAGYSPSQIGPRLVGRPSLGAGVSPRVQFRVDPATYQALLARAGKEHRGISEIARLALEQYLRSPVSAGSTDAEPARPASAQE